MAVQQRMGSDPYEDFTLGVQGWSALTVFALVMMLNSVIAVFRPPGWRSMPGGRDCLAHVRPGQRLGRCRARESGAVLGWGSALVGDCTDRVLLDPAAQTAPAGTSPTQ